MSLYYKKVDAKQFKLTDEQKALIKSRKAVFFEGSPVKHVGGDQYIALLQQGENLIKIQEGQWLVIHADGLWQIFWEDRFAANFIKGNDAEIELSIDPFTKPRHLKQPTNSLWVNL